MLRSLARLPRGRLPATFIQQPRLTPTSSIGLAGRRLLSVVADEDDGSTFASDRISGEEYRTKHKITLHGPLDGLDTDPVVSFSDVERTDPVEGIQSLPNSLLRFFDKKGFTEPSPIQAQSYPISLAGRDVIAVAQTGSGKTLGFLLPLFWSVDQMRKRGATHGPLAVVLAPTRELAQQIEQEAEALGRAFGCTTVCVFGGQAKHLQERRISQLRRRLDLVVATPGRLCDLIRDRVLPMHAVKFLVLDEADRMLDMGFEPQLREIAEEIPPPGPPANESEGGGGRQTLMFSATWPNEVRELASEFMGRDSVRISIGGEDKLVANQDITQTIQIQPNSLSKLEALGTLVEDMEAATARGGRRGGGGCHTVVFVNRKRDADMVAADIRDNTRVRAAALHGDLTQNRRDSVLNAVKQGRTSVLVATDVAARGLDVKTVKQVINFDMPTNMEDYIHRIGRTGRAGEKGEAISFLNPKVDESIVKHLVKVLTQHGQTIGDDLSELHERLAPKKFEKPNPRGRGGRGFASDNPRTGKCTSAAKPAIGRVTAPTSAAEATVRATAGEAAADIAAAAVATAAVVGAAAMVVVAATTNAAVSAMATVAGVEEVASTTVTSEATRDAVATGAVAAAVAASTTSTTFRGRD